MSTISLTLRRMTPDGVPADAPLSRLLSAFQQRAHYARTGRNDLGSGVGGHVLTALALAAALVARINAYRWPHVEIALRAGVPLGAVADAMGLDVEEVRVGYGYAVERAVIAGKLTPADAEMLRARLDDRR